LIIDNTSVTYSNSSCTFTTAKSILSGSLATQGFRETNLRTNSSAQHLSLPHDLMFSHPQMLLATTGKPSPTLGQDTLLKPFITIHLTHEFNQLFPPPKPWFADFSHHSLKTIISIGRLPFNHNCLPVPPAEFISTISPYCPFHPETYNHIFFSMAKFIIPNKKI